MFIPDLIRLTFHRKIIFFHFSSRSRIFGSQIWFGLSDRSIPNGETVGHCANSYCTTSGFHWLFEKYRCRISGKMHAFEWPEGSTKPELDEPSAGERCGRLWPFAESEQQIGHFLHFQWHSPR
jgi:hypothetical protein